MKGKMKLPAGYRFMSQTVVIDRNGDGIEVAAVSRTVEPKRKGVAIVAKADGSDIQIIMTGRDALCIASALQDAAYKAGEL